LRSLRHLILLFGIVNACLFSCLLPLWEGFDEAFHYSSVETLWQTGHFPVLGRTLVPDDVARSFEFAPLSHVVQRWIPNATTFEAWFSLSQTEKEQRRIDLTHLRPTPASSTRPDYEAHHPPLAYVTLALVDWPLQATPLTARLLILRVIAAITSVLLVYFGATALCRTLAMQERFINAALLTIFCSEMLYATTAHVSNDWLAVGLSACFLAALAEFMQKPERQSAVRAGAWLAAGLLTKAYFLPFAFLALSVATILVWRRRASMKALLPAFVLVFAFAGPWYTRNVALYGNISGTHEEFDGIGMRQALAAVPHIDWPATTGFLARSSLWTGNNSFTSFSRSTLNIVLALLFAALAAWAVQFKAIQAAERVTGAAIVLFSIAVGYATCAAFAHTKGEVAGASPWYTQVLLVPVLALAYLGMSRWRRLGTALAILTVALWSWILIATWTVKLFPMYSGAGTSPMRMRDLWNWYAHGAIVRAHDLSLVALVPAPLLYAGLAVSVVLCVLLSAAVIRDLVTLKYDAA